MFLAYGEFHTAFADFGLVAGGKLRDEFVRLGDFRQPDHFLFAGFRFAVAQIVQNRVIKQEDFLGDNAHDYNQLNLRYN